MATQTEEQLLTSRLTELSYEWRCRARDLYLHANATGADSASGAEAYARAGAMDDLAGELEVELGLVEDVCGTCGKPQSQCECE